MTIPTDDTLMGDIKDDANFQQTVADDNPLTGDIEDSPNIELQLVPIIAKGSYYYTYKQPSN